VRIGDHMRGHGRATLLLISFTAVAAAVAALTVGTAQAAPGPGTGASFVVECGINGVFELDPIAFTHHQHVESGSELFNKPGITADSITADSVRDPSNGTSCKDLEDKSAYWTPQLYENDGTAPEDELVPTLNDIYYRGGVAPSSVVAFPYSTQMLANQASKVQWECRTSTVQTFADAPGSCAGTLVAIIHFPQCWNGDKPAKMDDFRYPSNGRCSSPFDRVVPAITERWSFVAPDGEINGVKVSAGDGQLEDQSFEHADFLSGWNQDRLRFLIKDCIKGVPKSGTRPNRCRLIDPAQL
jgi:hypothetical protein